MVNGLWFFQLGDDRHIAVMSCDNLLHGTHVFGGANERQCNRVDAVL